MNRDKKLIVILPVLLVISAGVWVSGLKSPSVRKSSKAIEHVSTTKEELAALLKASAATQKTDDSPVAWGERNPFDLSPLDKKTVTKAAGAIKNPTVVSYHLSGIFWNEEKPSAIINDVVVGPGMMINSATVKEIRADRVILNDGDRNIELMAKSND